MRRRLTVRTVGCKASFADSASLLRLAAEAGFEVVGEDGPADVVFVNGCTVTHRADRDNRALVRRTRREMPDALIVVSGCFPSFAGDAARASLPEADLWTGMTGPQTLPLLRSLAGDVPPAGPLSDWAAGRVLGHRRTFLKIQDGCNCRCAYCAIPLARGEHRSVPADEVVDRARLSVQEGSLEILLTGIHIGRYGSDRGETDGLSRLLRRLLRETGRARFRLGSIEPLELTPGLLALLSDSPRLCPHLHVPLQSGSREVLSRMRRPYGPERFLEAVSAARLAVPGVRIGADVIAGFPGESDDDFRATISTIEDAGLDYLHVFPYSARPGTESAGWPDDVPARERSRRAAALRALDERLRSADLAKRAGRTAELFVLRHDPAAVRSTGIAGTGHEVVFPCAAPGRVGTLVRVRVAGPAPDGRLEGIPEYPVA